MNEVRAGCPMNGPIHPAATKQGRVRRVDNDLNRQRGDIGPDSAEDGSWLSNVHGCTSDPVAAAR